MVATYFIFLVLCWLCEGCVIGFGYMVVICLGVLVVFVYSMYYNNWYIT